jgi:uncharacterized membrane protein HdeD (DUF308 family)
MKTKQKSKEIVIEINKETLKKVLRIAVGLILLIFGLGFLTSLNNVFPEFIWLQVFLGVFLVLTGYGVLRKKLLSTYKSFTVFLF